MIRDQLRVRTLFWLHFSSVATFRAAIDHEPQCDSLEPVMDGKLNDEVSDSNADIGKIGASLEGMRELFVNTLLALFWSLWIPLLLLPPLLPEPDHLRLSTATLLDIGDGEGVVIAVILSCDPSKEWDYRTDQTFLVEETDQHLAQFFLVDFTGLTAMGQDQLERSKQNRQLNGKSSGWRFQPADQFLGRLAITVSNQLLQKRDGIPGSVAFEGVEGFDQIEATAIISKRKERPSKGRRLVLLVEFGQYIQG